MRPPVSMRTPLLLISAMNEPMLSISFWVGGSEAAVGAIVTMERILI